MSPDINHKLINSTQASAGKITNRSGSFCSLPHTVEAVAPAHIHPALVSLAHYTIMTLLARSAATANLQGPHEPVIDQFFTSLSVLLKETKALAVNTKPSVISLH